MNTRARGIYGIAAGAALTLAANTDAARAASVEVDAGTLTYFADSGVANFLTIVPEGAMLTIDDPVEATIFLGPLASAIGCTAFDSNTVRCPTSAVTALNILTRDGVDRIDLSAVTLPSTIDGGFSDDVVIGGAGSDVIVWVPGSGSDTIDGGPGDDVLLFSGSNINESIQVVARDAGFDVFRDVASIHLTVDGVEGFDLQTLGGSDLVRTVPLATTRQTLADGDDGITTDQLVLDAGGLCVTRAADVFSIEARQFVRVARFDNVLVENQFCLADPCATAVPTNGCTLNGVRDQPCVGGDGDDVIVGTKGADVILAGRGKDRVRGGDGDDLICGGEGNDVLAGGAGQDRVFGNDGDDRVKGDGGDDLVSGGPGNDDVAGGGGDDEVDGGIDDDRVRGQGGADTLRGGAGVDRLDGGSGTDVCTDIEAAPPFPHCELP